jgi:rhomboid protease GluP
MLAGFAVAALMSRGNPTTMAWAAAIMTILFLSMDMLLRRHINTGLDYVSLTPAGVESRNLPGNLELLRWQDIGGVAFKLVQGHPYLDFVMHESAGLPDKRSFWSGRKLSQPMLLLSPLSPVDQEALLGEIQSRLAHVCGGAIPAGGSLVNQIRQEREFAERLKALAPYAWTTYMLMTVNFGIWLWTLTAGASLLQAPPERLFNWGANAASELQRGEWWRLLTATFLHNGMTHALMNMIGLYVAGVGAERIYGRSQFLLIYFGAGLLGSAASLHYSAQHAVSVGASGAVFGVTGALLVAYMKHRADLPKASSKRAISGLGIFIVYALIQGFATQGVDNAAHLGGLLGGCLLAYILPARFDLDHYRRNASRNFAVGVVISALLISGIVYQSPRAAIDHSRIFASAEILRQGATKYQDAFKELQRLYDDTRAGALSEWEADAKARAELAPKFRAVVTDLRQVVLRPDDHRLETVADMLRLSELLAESLAMESIQQDGDTKPKPADPQRMAKMEAEIRQIGERMIKNRAILEKKQPNAVEIAPPES